MSDYACGLFGWIEKCGLVLKASLIGFSYCTAGVAGIHIVLISPNTVKVFPAQGSMFHLGCLPSSAFHNKSEVLWPHGKLCIGLLHSWRHSCFNWCFNLCKHVAFDSHGPHFDATGISLCLEQNLPHNQLYYEFKIKLNYEIITWFTVMFSLLKHDIITRYSGFIFKLV